MGLGRIGRCVRTMGHLRLRCTRPVGAAGRRLVRLARDPGDHRQRGWASGRHGAAANLVAHSGRQRRIAGIFVSQQEACGVHNAYRQPHQLGSDRFASAIGAHALFPATSLIVATCGTATTVDAVTADGVFVGGMILPGLRLMASSLARNTAQLPDVLQQSERLPPFADNTEEAIIGGCIAAQAGAIERAFATHARLNPDEPARLILSGGAAASIAPHLAIPYTHVDNLVLIGLQTFVQQRA